MKDFSKCHCEKAGFCPAFNKLMEENPPNWQWCQEASFQQREKYYLHNTTIPRNKRIGFYFTAYHECGGVETWCNQLVSMFYNEISGISVETSFHKNIRNLKIPYGKNEEFKKKLFEVSDIIVCWGAVKLKKYNPKKVIAVHHGYEHNEWNDLAIKNLDVNPSKIIAVNKETSNKYGYLYIPNTIDINRCSTKFDANSKTVLWPHRFTEEKDPELALSIASIMPDFKFIFCGSHMNPYFLNRLHAIKNATYLGAVPNLANLFEQSSILISTSNQESYGYSVAEAVYSGLPVISKPTGIATKIADKTIKSSNPFKWSKEIRLHSGTTAKYQDILINDKERFYKDWEAILC